MRALLVSLALLGACDAGAKPEPRPRVDQAALVRHASTDPFVDVDCSAVVAKVPSVIFAYDPKYFALATMIAPTLRASCIEDAWPEPLRRCIVQATPDALVDENACRYLVSPELAAKVAKRFGTTADGLSLGR